VASFVGWVERSETRRFSLMGFTSLNPSYGLAPNGGHAADVKEMLSMIAGGAAAREWGRNASVPDQNL